MARYATTDLHGCLRTFQRLVENQLRLKPQDELYVLGDYVNKGPNSRGVLDYLLHLSERGYRLVCLRGNHDQELLDAAQGRAELTWATSAERRATLQSFGVTQPTDVPEHYLRWLSNLPYQFDTPGFVLVHAGFDFRLPPEQMRQDWDTMLNTKSFVFDASRTGGRRLLHGHVPTPITRIQEQVERQSDAICLDAGCVYRHNPELAHLAALDLDSEKLFLQPNIEPEYSIAVR